SADSEAVCENAVRDSTVTAELGAHRPDVAARRKALLAAGTQRCSVTSASKTGLPAIRLLVERSIAVVKIVPRALIRLQLSAMPMDPLAESPVSRHIPCFLETAILSL